MRHHRAGVDDRPQGERRRRYIHGRAVDGDAGEVHHVRRAQLRDSGYQRREGQVRVLLLRSGGAAADGEVSRGAPAWREAVGEDAAAAVNAPACLREDGRVAPA